MLILFHGLSATGKTVLSREVADLLALPLVSKDQIKEAMHDAVPDAVHDIASSQALGAAAFDKAYAQIEAYLRSGDCVAETVWHPDRAEPQLRALLEKTHATCVQVFLFCDEEVRQRRFQHRADTSRHAAHRDGDRLAQRRSTKDRMAFNRPLNIPGGLIRVDTTDFSTVSAAAIVSEIKNPRHHAVRGCGRAPAGTGGASQKSPGEG